MRRAAAFSIVIADSQPASQPASCERCSAVSGLVTENFLNFAGEIATAFLPASEGAGIPRRVSEN